MNVLEKILEEIDNRKSYHEEKAYKQDDYEIQKMYCDEELDWITNIIRSHMNDVENDGWIPVEERLPGKTPNSCRLIREMGEPGKDGNGKCMGFTRNFTDDEPCEICKKCEWCTAREEGY